MELSEARREINAVNQQMRDLFLKRMALSSEVAAYKKAHGLPIEDRARELAILDAMSEGTGDFAPYVRRYFEAVMALSRAWQAEALPEKSLRDRKNVILVGMPGAGKSAVGKALAALSGREAFESDQWIIEQAGMTIPEIFAAHDEAFFRGLEHQAIETLSRKEGIILITGGGAVKKEENRALLSASGRVYRIDRPLEKLAREGRPLSEGADLAKIAAEREPFYQAASDITIQNDRSPEEAAAAIWDEFIAFFA